MHLPQDSLTFGSQALCTPRDGVNDQRVITGGITKNDHPANPPHRRGLQEGFGEGRVGCVFYRGVGLEKHWSKVPGKHGLGREFSWMWMGVLRFTVNSVHQD